jgi:hypothetical protein
MFKFFEKKGNMKGESKELRHGFYLFSPKISQFVEEMSPIFCKSFGKSVQIRIFMWDGKR